MLNILASHCGFCFVAISSFKAFTRSQLESSKVVEKEKEEKNNMGDSVSSVPSITVIILNGFRGTGTPKDRDEVERREV